MLAILTLLAGKIISGLKSAAGSLLGRAMGFAGLTFANFNVVLPELKLWLVEKASVLPAWAVEYLSAFGVDIMMTLILSAIVLRVGWKTFMTTVNSLEGMIQNANTN